MPVGLWRALCVLALLTMVLPSASHAQARVIIRHASQLADDKEVRRLMEAYSLASGANVVYAQCGDTLGVTDAQNQYLAQHFADVSQGGMKAFQNAFKTRTGGVSTKPLMDSYYAYMVAVQQEAVNRTAGLIAQKGCDHDSLTKTIQYYDKLKNRDAAGASQEAAPTL